MGVIKFARKQFQIQNQDGGTEADASVTVIDEDTGAAAVLYGDRDGANQIDNPLTSDADGFVYFHAVGGRYRIDAVKGAFSRTWRYVPVGTAQEYDANDLLFAFPMFFAASNKPDVGEELPPIDVPLDIKLLNDDFVGWYARARTAPTSQAIIQVMYRANATDSPAVLLTVTFDAGEKEGTFALADDVNIDAGSQIWVKFPNPRDATMADFSMVMLGLR